MCNKQPPADGILLVGTCSAGKPDSGIYDLMAFGHRLTELDAGSVQVLIVGADSACAAEEIADQSGFEVIALEGPGFCDYTAEAFCGLLAPRIQSLSPTLVGVIHDSKGAEWAPAVARRLDAACISNVEQVGRRDGRLYFEKALYGGKIKGRFTASGSTTMATIQPGCFQWEASQKSPGKGTVVLEQIPYTAGMTRFKGVEKAPFDTNSLSEARIVVAVGNGLQNREDLSSVEAFAALFGHAKVAGSRIVCDKGWLGYDRQVGVTGATVSPDLYVACGISGAAQHLMGMRGARLVIAINKDGQAPFFNEADVGVAEDLIPFLMEVLEQYETSRQQGKER